MPLSLDLSAPPQSQNQESQELLALIIKEVNIEISFQRGCSKMRPVNVRISQNDIDLARLLGGGSVSAGLRASMKVIATAMQIEQPHSGATPWRGFMGGWKDE